MACPSSPGQPSARQTPCTRSQPRRAPFQPPKGNRGTARTPESKFSQARRQRIWSGPGKGARNVGMWGARASRCRQRRASMPSRGLPRQGGPPRLEGPSGDGIWARGMGCRTGAAPGRAARAHARSTVDRHPAAAPGGTQTGQGRLSRCTPRPPSARPALTATLACRRCPRRLPAGTRSGTSFAADPRAAPHAQKACPGSPLKHAEPWGGTRGSA